MHALIHNQCAPAVIVLYYPGQESGGGQGSPLPVEAVGVSNHKHATTVEP